MLCIGPAGRVPSNFGDHANQVYLVVAAAAVATAVVVVVVVVVVINDRQVTDQCGWCRKPVTAD